MAQGVASVLSNERGNIVTNGTSGPILAGMIVGKHYLINCPSTET
jgi:hypothetical protein